MALDDLLSPDIPDRFQRMKHKRTNFRDLRYLVGIVKDVHLRRDDVVLTYAPGEELYQGRGFRIYDQVEISYAELLDPELIATAAGKRIGVTVDLYDLKTLMVEISGHLIMDRRNSTPCSRPMALWRKFKTTWHSRHG